MAGSKIPQRFHALQRPVPRPAYFLRRISSWPPRRGAPSAERDRGRSQPTFGSDQTRATATAPRSAIFLENHASSRPSGIPPARRNPANLLSVRTVAIPLGILRLAAAAFLRLRSRNRRRSRMRAIAIALSILGFTTAALFRFHDEGAWERGDGNQLRSRETNLIRKSTGHLGKPSRRQG